MKNPLHTLQKMPPSKKKLTIIIVAIVIGVIGLATYPLWGTDLSRFSSPSFVKTVANDFSATTSNIQSLTNTTQDVATQIRNQQDNFQNKLGTNEFFTNEEQDINSVAMNVRKVLLDANKTIVWFRVSNLTQNTIQVDPQSNLEITASGVTYLPRPLDDATLAATYQAEQGQLEILDKSSLPPQASLEGYIVFQTVPVGTTTFTIRYHNVLNKDTLKKWTYNFVFDVEKLKTDKAAKK